jgi:multicomponent Na+:H+ antiporter subunit B
VSGSPVILRTGTRVLFPMLLVFSAFLLLRGHNEPGGGFVGGLVASMAYALVLVAEGPAAARRALRADPRVLIGLGLGTALASGLVAFLAGRPFLTGLWLDLPLPAVGKLGSPVVFDAGVYLVVLGVVLAMLLALAEEEG